MLNGFRQWLRTRFFRQRLERGRQAEMAAYPRHVRGARGIESVIADLRFGLRLFERKPFSTLTMVVVLALGIGFNTALFVFVYSLVNSPPPGVVRDESLVRIRGINQRAPGYTTGREFSYPEYREYAAQPGLFTAVAAWTSSDVVLDVGGREEHLLSGAATYVTANYFLVLGVRPIVGAGLPDVPAPPLVAVISHVVWERHFGLAPDVVGKTLKVNGFPVTIVGVAPRRFAGARTGGSQVRVWLPLSARPLLQRTPTSDLVSYDSAVFGLVARLAPGIDVSQTLPTVQAIAALSAQQTTRVLSGTPSTDVVTLLADNYFPPSGETSDGIGRAASLMIPLLILSITCTNVSALLAGLAVARRREIAVRLSLGAARSRIVRQLVTESVLLALAAGALGLFVIWVLLSVFDSSVADVQIVLDWRGLLFTFGFAVATGIVFGISPALHATRLALSDVTQGHGRLSRRRPFAAAVGIRRRADRADTARASGHGRDDPGNEGGSPQAPVSSLCRSDSGRALQHQSAVWISGPDARRHVAALADAIGCVARRGGSRRARERRRLLRRFSAPRGSTDRCRGGDESARPRASRSRRLFSTHGDSFRSGTRLRGCRQGRQRRYCDWR